MRAHTYIPRGTQRQVCELRRQVPGCGTGAQVCEFGPAPACGGGPCCVNTAHSRAHAGRHVCAPSQVWAHVPDLAPMPAITRRCTGSLTGGQTRPPHPCARTRTPPCRRAPPCPRTPRHAPWPPGATLVGNSFHGSLRARRRLGLASLPLEKSSRRHRPTRASSRGGCPPEPGPASGMRGSGREARKTCSPRDLNVCAWHPGAAWAGPAVGA